MADRPLSPAPGEAPQGASRAGGADVYSTPGTIKGPPKGTVGVYDRPSHALGSWSPIPLIALILGVLLLLWMFGIFKYLLG